jgi:LuxR family maltose regulon positive regulatory protein
LLAAGPRSGALRNEVGRYPIELAKVQRPALRDETLERPRLLDWLRAKVHGRVVLVLADAGYGKTTLLADFSRRTRMRTLWYRLDEGDRDWTSLLHHLVAAGREHDPTFAPATADLLADVSAGGPTRDIVLDAFLRELPSIAASGVVLILDDFHLVDDAPDARHIARELVARAPERVAIVFASRRAPAVPLAKLRAIGDVAELGTDDLRFDAAETEQLFTKTYGRQLDPDVLADLAVRTEGWVLSLQLVQAALRDRTPTEVRRFVRGLTGADRELYDYLAEEVVGELPDEMQRFLMETSILQIVTPELAEVVTRGSSSDVARLMTAAERLTLLSRVSGGPRTHQRYHPLVREFLEARLRSVDGDAAVAELHRRTANDLAATDWKTSAHHYREAGDTVALLGVIGQAIPTIMGNGQYALADAFIRPIPQDLRPPGFDLILSRVNLQHGDYEAGIAASRAVLESATDEPMHRDHALLNLLGLYLNFGDAERALEYAATLSAISADPNLVGIAEATAALVHSAEDGNIDVVSQRLQGLARNQRADKRHHFGVSMYNLACCSLVQDRLDDALREVNEALEVLDESPSGVERAAAIALRVSLFARLGSLRNADRDISEQLLGAVDHLEHEALIEVAEAHASFGSLDKAEALLERASTRGPMTLVAKRMMAATKCTRLVRQGSFGAALEALDSVRDISGTLPGSRAGTLALRAYVSVAANETEAKELASNAVRHATAQRAHAWRRVSELLASTATSPSALNDAVVAVGEQAPWHLTYLADVLVPRLDALSAQATQAISFAANLHRDRWRDSLRSWLMVAPANATSAPAHLLESIGDRSDIPRLRAIGRLTKRGGAGASLGKQLARRLADRVQIEDQGRVVLHVGPRTVIGSDVRRKVLALICFLVTRSDFSATRDQVLDALWPDLDPELAQNSLNQTLYFLRRVFEENYSDDLSPGYVRHDSDVIWLDPELVTARSVQCRDFVRGLPPRPNPDEVQRLVQMYRGRFALDFEYEEWANAYRDGLHAAFLEIVERSVLDDFTAGHFDRGIGVARRALEVDPTAEQIEISLLRMYRATGAHAAAAEQYAHYASVIRAELGVDPPPLEAL